MNDLKRTVHYTTNASTILSNLLHYVPTDAQLVEPFVGNGDLVSLFPNHKWEKYDIQELGHNIVQDTLLSPSNYHNKWVITNPPYLAKNKAKGSKEIYTQYGVDDLYKAALLSFMECEGGIVIIPINFFTDERSEAIRRKFLNKFVVKEMNVYNCPVFETTTYSVCCFAFQRKTTPTNEQSFLVNICPQDAHPTISIEECFGYQIGGKTLWAMKKQKNYFGRLVVGADGANATNIQLYALDTREKRIRLEYNEVPYYGKATDRMRATLVCDKQLSEEVQRELIEKFNSVIEEFRVAYYDLPLTNYRDFGRKRISFDFAYKLLSWVLDEIILTKP